MSNRFERLLLLLLLGALLLVACESAQDTEVPVPPPPGEFQTLHNSVTPQESAVAPAVPTPDDVDATVSAFSRALGAADPTQLGPLLLDSLWLAPEEDSSSGRSLNQTEGAAWLAQHWGSKRAVASVNYVRDSALLEIETSGWAQLPRGVVLFHLHRYDSAGREDDMQGSWRIDSILY